MARSLKPEAQDRGEVVEALREAASRGVIEGDALAMLEGVLTVGDIQVRDNMVPRAQMDVIDINDGPEKFVPSVIATAHSVAGVASVEAAAFGRQGGTDPLPLQQGVLALSPPEIARLANDPNFPEHGLLVLDLHGGQ